MSNFAQILAYSYIIVQSSICVVSSFVALFASKQNETNCWKVFRLWLKTMWKMRNVYSAFAVHIFDVMTDLLVIAQWWNEEKGSNETNHVDTRLMAICSLGVLLFHKVISTIAIYVTTNRNKFRAFLQFWDLLLFEEMFIAHKKIVKKMTTKTEFTNNTNKKKKGISFFMQRNCLCVETKETETQTKRKTFSMFFVVDFLYFLQK